MSTNTDGWGKLNSRPLCQLYEIVHPEFILDVYPFQLWSPVRFCFHIASVVRGKQCDTLQSRLSQQLWGRDRRIQT